MKKTPPKTINKRWDLIPFFKYHLLALALLLSLFIPATFLFWRKIDTAIFFALNKTLLWGKSWQIFWTFSNHKFHDWIEDGIFILFFVLYVKTPSAKPKAQKIAECITIILFTATFIWFINKTFIRETLQFDWPSPTMVYFNSCNKLSQLVPWLEIKEMAKKSFPGDHATTAVLFAALFAPLTEGKMRRFALAYSAFLCLPRLVAGAHWLSDILVGSIALGLLAHAWYFFTPIEKIPSFFVRSSKKVSARLS